MALIRSLARRLARLEEHHAPPGLPAVLRIVRVILDRDGFARRAVVRTADGLRELPPEELAALGLPRRVVPGWPRDMPGFAHEKRAK